MSSIKGITPRINTALTNVDGTSAKAAKSAAADVAPQTLAGPERPQGFTPDSGVGAASSNRTGLNAISLQIDQPKTVKDPSTFRFDKYDGPPVTFPLTPDQALKLRNCNAVSPVLPSDPQVHVHADFLPKPTHPGDEGFWGEFEEIIDLQVARRAGGQASQMLDVPKVFEGYSMDEAAQAVRADFPSKWPSALAEQFLSEGAKMDASIVPQRTQADFVNSTVLLSRTIGWAVSEVSPSAFACKWSEGRARPESVAWAVHTGELDAPQEIKDKIAALKLTKPEDFTAYKRAHPRHPSWPAMHSAASSASLYMAVLMDLSPEQIAEAQKMDFAVATFRSAAGVHYDTDNRAGLALGQEVIARQLPDYLAQFGADPDAVRAKIEKVRHDWFAYQGKANPS